MSKGKSLKTKFRQRANRYQHAGQILSLDIFHEDIIDMVIYSRWDTNIGPD